MWVCLFFFRGVEKGGSCVIPHSGGPTWACDPRDGPQLLEPFSEDAHKKDS